MLIAWTSSPLINEFQSSRSKAHVDLVSCFSFPDILETVRGSKTNLEEAVSSLQQQRARCSALEAGSSVMSVAMRWCLCTPGFA